MKEKSILLVATFALSIAFIALSFRESYLANPTNSDWWSLSFASQQETDASFTVSNFGPTRVFFYEIRESDTVSESASFTLSGASEQTILAKNPDKHPITVRVWTESDANKESKDFSKKKEIYKR